MATISLDARYVLPQPWWLVIALYEGLLVGAWLVERGLLRRIRAAAGDPIGGARTDRRFRLYWVVLFLMLQWPVYRVGWMSLLPWRWSTVFIGLFVALAGAAIRIRAIRHLAANFTYVVNVGAHHRLVTSGPYARIRHPAYLGLILFFAGVPTVLCDHRLVMIFGTVTMVVVALRMRREERALRARFGAEYETWRQRTKRLIPGVF